MIRSLLINNKRIRINAGATVCHPCKHARPVLEHHPESTCDYTGAWIPPWHCDVFHVAVDWNDAMTLPGRPSKCRAAERAAKRPSERKKAAR